MTVPKRLAVILLAATVLLALPQPARAKTIKVGDGTAGSCTEAALQNALVFAAAEKNGVIQFRCGAAPITITVTTTLTPPHNTTIDGDGLIRLQGNIPAALMLVDQGIAVALKGLTIANQTSNVFVEAPGLHNKGTLTVRNCAFSNNLAGAIFNEGSLIVRDSTVSDNGSSPEIHVGGIVNMGVLRVTNSVFERNKGQGAGAIANDGDATIADTTFADNEDVVVGGAIANFGTLTVRNSDFARNSAGHFGGAIFSAGQAKVTTSSFIENRQESDGFGGAITNTGKLSVYDSSFSGNGINGPAGGGAVSNSGQLDVHRSELSGNMASVGGAFLNSNTGTLVIDSSIITGNTAVVGRSGQGTGGGVSNQGILRIRNSLIVGNTAAVDGGGIHSCCGGTLTLNDTIVFGNTPNNVVQ
jgi:predicted outer membrane repeat protein